MFEGDCVFNEQFVQLPENISQLVRWQYSRLHQLIPVLCVLGFVVLNAAHTFFSVWVIVQFSNCHRFVLLLLSLATRQGFITFKRISGRHYIPKQQSDLREVCLEPLSNPMRLYLYLILCVKPCI